MRAVYSTLAAGLLVMTAVAATTAESAAQGKAPAGCSDTSPHRQSFVTVAPGVRLEVLDWGGSGSALLFLAGLGDTGHEFDDFAPRFTDHHHVLAITRRGYGASSHPDSGYDVGTLARDIHVAIDSLRLGRVTLIGHSFGGDEMSQFAARWPDQLNGLIYLDAAHDRTQLADVWQSFASLSPPTMTSADSASPAAVQRYDQETFGIPLPIGWVCSTTRFDSAGRFAGPVTPDSMVQVVVSQTARPPYERIHAPTLAIYAVQRSAKALFPWYDSMNAAERADAGRAFNVLHDWELAQIATVKRVLAGARVVDIPDANHYVFVSNEPQVERAMRSFLKGLR